MNRRISYLLIVCIVMMATGCSPTLHGTIRDLGYKPAALPSEALRPGTLVKVKQEDPFDYNTVCEFGTYIGVPTVTKDKAASITLENKLTRTLSLGASYIKQLKMNASYKSVKDISVRLSNVIVEEVSDAQVYNNFNAQAPACSQAIENIRERSRLSFIQKSLRADAVYTVTFDQKGKLEAGAQPEILRGLAAELGLTPESVENNRISGENLYWGVQLRHDLVSSTPPTSATITPESSPIDTIPYVNQAEKMESFDSLGQFNINSDAELADVSTLVSGYFDLKAHPSPRVYTYALATTKSIFKPNFFASVRIAPSKGANTLELSGCGVVFGINASANRFFVYESEAHWTLWQPLKVERSHEINELAIYQKGREVSAFLNGNHVTTFTKYKEAKPGHITVQFKADPQIGGLIHFQKLTVWEFPD
jgi:hypothetical protein